jgi:hypothetical protein
MLKAILFLCLWLKFIQTNILHEAEIKKEIMKSFIESNKPHKEIFKTFHFLFKKEYELNSEEGVRRYKIFKQNLKYVLQKNKLGLKYKLGVNEFSDLTHMEFKNSYLMREEEYMKQHQKFFNEIAKDNKNEDNTHTTSLEVNEDINIDWSSHFLPARKQGVCGSCYAFTSTGAIEAAYSIKGKPLKQYLSTQQIVDCSRNQYNTGCTGGLANFVFRYASDTGITFEKDYPYKSGETGESGQCRDNRKGLVKTYVTGYSYCTNYNHGEGRIKNCDFNTWLGFLKKGPICVGLYGDSQDFQFYESGIFEFYEKECGHQNHAVIVVGFGKDENGHTFVKVRNSWGTSWGQKGYARILYAPTNSDTCFATGSAYIPLIE